MTRETDSISVAFSIAGRDFSPEECTAQIGISPTEIWRQSNPVLRKRLDLHNVNWTIALVPVESDSISDPVERLLAIVWPRRKDIVTLSQRLSAEVLVTCNVHVFHHAPEYSLSSRAIAMLAELGAEFLMDVFDHRTAGP